MWRDIDDIVEVEMMLSGPPGTGITAAEKTQIDTRLATLEGQTLSDLLDTPPTTGQVPIYDGTSGTWSGGTMPGGITTVTEQGVIVNSATRVLDFYTDGFTVETISGFEGAEGWARVSPNFGTAAGRVAEGNHTHDYPLPERYDLASPGSVPTIYSTTSLITANIGPFTEGLRTVVEVDAHIDAEGVDDPARCNIIIEIDGTSYSSAVVPRTEPFTWEWGVNSERSWQAAKAITRATGGASTRTVTLKVQWIEWGGLNVKSAWMNVKRTPER